MPEAGLVDTRELMDGAAIGRALRRMAHEIVERAGGADELCLVGIRTGGVHLAERLRALIAEHEGAAVPVGVLDITLYRDDVFEGMARPLVGPTQLPFAVRGRKIVLVDDVLYTGRTVKAALDALMEFGRPRFVQLAVLIDRGWRELPIQPDYAGLRVETRRDESVKVLLSEKKEPDRVVVREKARP